MELIILLLVFVAFMVFMSHLVKKDAPTEVISLLKEKTKTETLTLAKNRGISLDKDNVDSEVNRHIDEITSHKAAPPE